MDKYIVGLTGGIASGKSAVSSILETLGAYIIDTDIVSRDIVKPGTVGYNRIAEVFPEVIEGGEINRRSLRQIVFADKDKLRQLNDITHPLIISAVKVAIETCNRDIVVIVAPLLFESNLGGMCDTVVTVSTGNKLRIERLMNRDNISKQLADAIFDSQLSDSEKEQLSDYVLRNDDDLGTLAAVSAQIYNEILEKFDKKKQ